MTGTYDSWRDAQAPSEITGWGHTGPCNPGCTCVNAVPPLLPGPRRCPATTRHDHPFGGGATGVQCKYEQGHDGDHAGYAGFGAGDIFWARAVADAPGPAEG